jgi:putative ABC transport system permease protein
VKRLTLSINGFTYYWRTHLGVLLGVMVSSMALTGALLVGDCVDYTLRSIAVKRLGNIEYALQHQSRFFREEIADELAQSLSTPVYPVYQLQGIVRNSQGTLSANNVSIYGITNDFGQLSQSPFSINLTENDIAISQHVANRLSLKQGDTVILRVDNPSMISREVPLSTLEDSALAFRLTVKEILQDDQMGRFDLRANQTSPKNVFVSLSLLQAKTNQDKKINMLLTGKGETQTSIDWINEELQNHWSLTDSQLEILDTKLPNVAELRTERIFFSSTSIHNTNHQFGILTYFVNQLKSQNNTTPYSMVSAIEPNDTACQLYPSLSGLKDGEIVINQWIADDLNASTGDTLTLKYNILGPMRKLIEGEKTFTIRNVIPMSDPLNDPQLMPDFPGIADSEHCRDWDPGFIIDLDLIRDKDETYWDEYKGTPKAFITLKDGKTMWSNRYGDVTAIRYYDSNITKENLISLISSTLDPQSQGVEFIDVREQAINAVDNAMSFGPLFLSLSFFLIISALILTTLLFIFGIEQRSSEIGLLYALGFTVKQIKRFYLLEAFILSMTGSLIGVIAAIAYSNVMIIALSTIWSGAVAGIPFETTVSYKTLVIGYITSIIVSLLSIWFGLRRVSKLPVNTLLYSKGNFDLFSSVKSSSNRSKWIAILSIVFAICMILLIPQDDAASAAGKFFGIGALLLVSCLSISQMIMSWLARQSNENNLTISNLGIRNNTRRTGRSMTVMSLLACGSFLVVAVGANRHDALLHADDPSSGTGGFAYWAETTLPLLHDLNTEEGCNEFGFSREDTPEMSVYPVRLRPGDDASCLNLNRAQNPKIIAINPESFSERKAFTFLQVQEGSTDSSKAWLLLNRSIDERTIPAFVDQSTAMWALGKSLGDTLTYKDDNGDEIQIQIVGIFANSVFHGTIVIAEDNFIQHFPSITGYQIILFDIPQSQRAAYKTILIDSLQDIGIDMTLVSDRLSDLYAIENTYLTIFQILGGFGLIIGCIGIGVVVLRNVLERRSEIALLRSIGFSQKSVHWLIVSEHSFLLIMGLICGSIAGLISAMPALVYQANPLPIFSLTFLMLLMFLSGIVWILIATSAAMRENLITALRSE